MTSISAPVIDRTPSTVAGLLGRDERWFAQTYESHFQSVHRYALLLVHDVDRADDLTADVFLKAWRSRDTVREERKQLSWLLSIAHNTAVSELRRDRGQTAIDDIPEPGDPCPDPGEQLDINADAEELREAILLLTPDQQQVVLLRFFEGLSHEEVAARLGRNANAIRAIQFRALSRLRRLLEGNDVRSA